MNLVENRVITTDELALANAQEWDGTLQLSAILIDRLEPLGLHIVIPVAALGEDGSMLTCMLQLHTHDSDEVVSVLVTISAEFYSSLPTASKVIGAAMALVDGLANDQSCGREANPGRAGSHPGYL
jgi:hypothetical protein